VSLGIRLGKLRGRSFAELRERVGQDLARRSERLGWRDASEPGDDALFALLEAPLRSRAAWRDAFAARPLPTLFAGFAAPADTARAIRSVDAAYAGAVLQRADAALGGRFDMLGFRDLSFGWPIDWHLDPASGVRAPRRHWSRIDFLDPRVAGDHKVVWELNRQQWLVDLGAAWWLTGDDRYARGIVEALTQWMDGNPPKLGVNWASSLEVAFRSISWVWALEFLRQSPLLDPATFTRLTKFLVLHGRHIERYLSTYYSPNTHLTGEALALFYIGTYLPELRLAARWRERGAAVLLEQLSHHVLRDGVYFEQTVHYHRYTVDFYTHFWLLDEMNGGTRRVEIAPQLESLLEHLQCLTRGDGTVPMLGDEDGGRLFFLDARPLNDMRGPLATGAVLLERGDLAYVARSPTAELVWLAGPAAVARFNALHKRPPAYASRGFEHGGVYVMRDGWAGDANHVVLDCGPHGTMNCGHAHADALSFELALRGRPVLVDPGTYTYTVDAKERDAFRSSAAHNAATVDGHDSSEPNGPFQWRRVAASRVLTFRVDEPEGARAHFEGAHDGFERLPSPVRYRRAMTFDPAASELLVISDTFDAGGPHRALLTFQCAPGIVPVIEGSRVRLEHARATLGYLQTTSSRAPGRFEIADAWVSPAYGARTRAARCCYVAELEAGTTVLTTTIQLARAYAAAATAALPALSEAR
jgi:hypothetical protein